MREGLAALLKRVSCAESATESEMVRIIGFLATKTTMADDELFLIKHLTKAAGKHMVNPGYQPVNEFLERLYLFNIQGAAKTRKQSYLSLNNKVKVRVHFIGYAADISVRLYNQTENQLWLKRWYLFRKYCAEQSVEIEPKYAAYSFLAAARAAFGIFEHISRLPIPDENDKLAWLQRAYDCSLARLYVKYPSEKAGYSHLHCGHYMRQIFSITLDKKHAEEAVASYKKFLAFPSFHNRLKEDITAKIKSLEKFI